MFNRKEVNAPLVDMIVTNTKALKKFGKEPVNYHYTLGQNIRQYQIPVENIHMSKGFLERWNTITLEEVFGGYDEAIVCEYDDILLHKFKGSSKEYTEVVAMKGDKIKWNDIFHCEHVITVHDIITALCALEEVTAEAVVEILDTMHYCRITKEEDHKINEIGGVKYHREGSYEDIINNIYGKAGIEII